MERLFVDNLIRGQQRKLRAKEKDKQQLSLQFGMTSF